MITITDARFTSMSNLMPLLIILSATTLCHYFSTFGEQSDSNNRRTFGALLFPVLLCAVTRIERPKRWLK